MKKLIVALAASALGLASCSLFEAGDMAAPSARTQRTIGVYVSAGVIKVYENVAGAGPEQEEFRFVSDTPGYTFPPANGIIFDEPPFTLPLPAGCMTAGDPVSAFVLPCVAAAGGREMLCQRKAYGYVPGACYKYTVALKKTGGGSPRPLDPWIKNERVTVDPKRPEK